MDVVDHRLFVLGTIVGEIVPDFFQRLPDAGHVAMAEDAEHSREHALLDAVTLEILIGEKANQRLRCRHPYRLHHSLHCAPGVVPSYLVRLPASPLMRFSISFQDATPAFISSFQVARTQACFGSSDGCIVRTGSSPASTLR